VLKGFLSFGEAVTTSLLYLVHPKLRLGYVERPAQRAEVGDGIVSRARF
jgi:hypothetical protein